MNKRLYVSVAVAAAVVAAGVVNTPALAHDKDNNHQQSGNRNQVVTVVKTEDGKHITVKNHQNSVVVHKDGCSKYVKVENSHNRVEVRKTDDDCKKQDKKDDDHKDNKKTDKPVKNEDKPATVAPVATVKAASTEQPQVLPETGAASLAALGGGAAVLGYAANLLRLRRRG